MLFLFFISLVLVQTYGAPTELVRDGSDLVNLLEEKVMSPKESTHLETFGLTNELTSMVNKTKLGNYTIPSPPSIDMVEEIPKGLIFEAETYLDGGKHLSETITAKIVGPVVIFNSKVAAAAGALPPLLAVKGAIIGSAIATPIEIGAIAGSSIVSGVTGKLVAIPISAAIGTVAKVVGEVEKGRRIWNFNVEHGGEILKDGVIKMGHIILKPVAVIVGAQTALTGAGLGITGTGIKGVGVGIESVGAKMVAAGLAAKGLGTTLIKSQFVN